MNIVKAIGVLVFSSLIFTQTASASSLDQWASTVVDFSSEYSTGAWSADNALGPPNVPTYYDNGNAWAPSSMNGTSEYITLGFATAVYSNGADIYENQGNGFVTSIDAIDTKGVSHVVWSGKDPSLPDTIVDFQPSWRTTPYLTQALTINVDTNHNMNTWEEIDAVRLDGQTQPPITPEPSSLILGFLSLIPILKKTRKPSEKFFS